MRLPPLGEGKLGRDRETKPVAGHTVQKDLKKVKKGLPLSQVLLVRGRLEAGRSLTVADGYHRICASYHLDEDASIPCRLADIPGASAADHRGGPHRRAGAPS